MENSTITASYEAEERPGELQEEVQGRSRRSEAEVNTLFLLFFHATGLLINDYEIYY